MLRFTIRNEVWHGPVLGLSGLGIARVKTHLVLSDETQKKIAEIFGPKDPLEIVTRVGFTGGGTTTLHVGRPHDQAGQQVGDFLGDLQARDRLFA